MALPITLQISIPSIQFHDINFFTVEDYLAQSILENYAKYFEFKEKRDVEMSKVPALSKRVNDLLSTIDEQKTRYSKQRTADMEEKCFKLLGELLEARETCDNLQGEMTALFRLIYVGWRNILAWRHAHVWLFPIFSSTPVEYVPLQRVQAVWG